MELMMFTFDEESSTITHHVGGLSLSEINRLHEMAIDVLIIGGSNLTILPPPFSSENAKYLGIRENESK